MFFWACVYLRWRARATASARARQGGQHAHCVVPRVMDTPALPFLLNAASLWRSQANKIKGCTGRCFHREGRRGDAQDHIGALADRRGHAGPVAIAVVRHRDMAWPGA